MSEYIPRDTPSSKRYVPSEGTGAAIITGLAGARQYVVRLSSYVPCFLTLLLPKNMKNMKKEVSSSGELKRERERISTRLVCNE